MKRVVAFLLLVALGALALYFAIGGEGFARSVRPAPQPGERPAPGTTGQGVPVRHGASQVGVTVSGALELRAPGKREQVGDRVIEHSAYELKCRDSRAVGDGRQQLDGVDVRIFDRGQPAARLQAETALVELGRDPDGGVSLRQDKQVLLQRAVLTSLPEARMGPFRLEGGQLRVQLADDAIVLETDTEQDPVSLVIEGQRPASLRGRGLAARLPKEPGGRIGRLEVAILHDSSIEAQDLTVTAAGRLLYVEQVRAGTALVTVDRDIKLSLRDAGLPNGAERGPVEVDGDHLSGWLLRERSAAGAGEGATGGERETASWKLLRLEGQPARVRAPGVDLTSQRLTVVPGPGGQPWLFTAGGTDNRLVQTDARSGRTATFTTSRRLHLVRPGHQIGELHRLFGFPMASLRPLYDLQVAVFAGTTHADTGDGTQIDASRGLRVYRPHPETDALIARGLGDVRIEHRAPAPAAAILASGNDGFLLRRDHSGETVAFGPADTAEGPAVAAHAYELQQGDLRIQGRGHCRLTRPDERRVALELVSPEPSIVITAEREPLRLSQVDRLSVEWLDERITSCVAEGPPARVDWNADGQQLTATAPVLRKVGEHSWMLQTPAGGDPRWRRLDPEASQPQVRWERPAADGSSENVRLEAPVIALHAVGHRLAVVDAVGDGHLPVLARGTVTQKGANVGTSIAATARRMRVLPFLVTPEALATHAAGLAPGLREFVHRGIAAPWLIADHVEDLDVCDPTQGRVRGSGERLLLARGAEAGLAIGDPTTMSPARIERIGDDGRVVRASGARVRFFREAADGLVVLTTFPGRSAFLAPEVEFRDSGNGASALGNLRASCRGEVEVLPDAVRFQGPVQARGLLPDGSEDPVGLRIATTDLRLLRDATTGEVVRVEARGDVVLDWSRIGARCRELDVDLPWQRCVVRDPLGAEVWLPDGQYFRARHLEANYRTLAVDSYDGRFEQRPPAGEAGR